MAVTIVTDSTHYLPREIVAERNLVEVSLYVHWAGRADRESDLPDFDAYYEHLRTATDLPTTSQPSTGDFAAAYEPILARGDDIVSIHIAGGISGTVESARQAAQHLAEEGKGGERIRVVDSRTTCGGLGFIVCAASAAARDGGDLDAVVARTEQAMAGTKLWFSIDTLEFLRRGGRIGSAQAWLGSALKIKPILTVDGEITPIERVRTSGRAFERMVEYLGERKSDGCDTWSVQHIQARDVCDRVVARGREVFGNEPFFTDEIGPVIGTHVGPGLIGVSAIDGALLR